MSGRELIGFGMFAAAALYGFRAYQQYKVQNGAIQITQAPEPVAPNAYAPAQTSFDLGWMSDLFDWPDFVPDFVSDANASIPANTAMPSVGNSIDYDTLTLARTIYGEANRETVAGQEAVANVILNRTRSSRWPSTVAAVCLQSKQFSCWNVGDPMRDRIRYLQVGSSSLFDRCVEVAKRATSGRLRDNTGGATHYYANYIATPSWVRNSPNATVTVQYGVHKFYKGIA